MRTLLLLFFFTALIFKGNSQTTFNFDNLPNPQTTLGYKWFYAKTFSLQLSGTNAVWDFSNGQAVSPTPSEFRLANVQEFPELPLVEGANRVYHRADNASEQYFHVQADASGLWIKSEGEFGQPTVTIRYIGGNQELKFPTNVGDSFESNYETLSVFDFGTPNVDSTMFKNTTSVQNDVLASGTILLPGGVSYEAMCIKRVTSTVDSNFNKVNGVWEFNFASTGTSYKVDFLSPQIGYYVARIFAFDENLNGGQVDYLVSTTATVNDLESDSGFELFPNPSDAAAFLKMENFKNIQELRITDIQGRFFQGISLNGSSEVIELNTENYPEGIYFVHLIGETDRIVRKLLVQHR